MSKPRITITNWDQILHKFTDGRRPIWVKLYLSLLHNRRWRMMSGDASKLYMDLVMLAAQEEPYGTISLYPDDLAYEVRLTVPEVQKSLIEVSDSGLIKATGYTFDVKMMTDGRQADDTLTSESHQDDALEESRGEESRRETTLVRSQKRDPAMVYVDPLEWERFEKDFGLEHREPLAVALGR